MPKRKIERLTTRQRRIRADIEAIADLIAMDHWNILDYARKARTGMLEAMRNKLVRGQVVMKYTLIDEYLSVIICHYYFRRPQNQIFRDLWRTKKFTIFNYHVLDELFLLAKLRLVRAIREVPKPIREHIERINALRNALAHSLFPENRRQFRLHKKVLYRGSDIFTLAGMTNFAADCRDVQNYLNRRAWGV